ncbi:DNA circularization protein [Pseudacidovorax intermedius]|uniref:DNA circularization protein n=1 Tax=Pseudacidovorax intermedius TaxID=433924 RepID=UPI0026EEC961|nr:DNA circularization N-terminal domain-containing protein [Pseudacidovorax intermedius]
MSWRDELVGDASWRGVPFYTTEAVLKLGRRNVLNEYPMRDTPYVDDLGRKARTYHVEGYLIGEDYLDDRRDLEEALETEGPGELVHPRYGRVWVSLLGEAEFRESFKEQGISRFTATFVEDSDNRQPEAVTDTANAVESAAAAADDAAAAAFAEDLDVEGPQVLSDLAELDLLGAVNDLVDLARSSMQPALLGDLVDAATGVVDDAMALLRTPQTLADTLAGLYVDTVAGVRGLVDGLTAPHLGLMTGLQGLNAGAAVNMATHQAARAAAAAGGVVATPSRTVLNAAAQADLVRRLAVTAQARLLALGMTEGAVLTASDAVAWRDALTAQIDAELEGADPDAATARALMQVRAGVVRDVATRAELLKQRSSFTTLAVLPAVVVAHRVYQDATRADELVERNAVRHPAFVPAGPLEVLL